MPRRSRKGPQAKDAAMLPLPHGLGVVLGAGVTKTSATIEKSPFSNLPSIADSQPTVDSIANAHPLPIPQTSFTPEVPVEAIATTAVTSEEAGVKKIQTPSLFRLETASVNTPISGGRQLRPRNPKVNVQKSLAQDTLSFSVTKLQHADRQDSKSTTLKRKAQTEGISDAGNQDILEPKTKRAKRIARKTKDNPYGLTPGVSPFPTWVPPTAEQCEEVFDLLRKTHNTVLTQSPEVIPPPSLEVTGCGEVPSLLDGLLRTYLSTAVSMDSSNKMLQNVAAKFGVLNGGIGNGSVDWNNVRLHKTEVLYDAIRKGGLATEKSKNIKTILDMVYEENVERRKAYLEERKTGVHANVFAAAEKTDGQKDFEVQAVEQNVLSLEHLRGLPSDDVMKHLTKYPGIGVKTSACVILFCLQIPCFAVDTHVHRFARWLGWVPEKTNADDTFSHLDVRCPDQFKYGLHQLFIQHGKLCGKCKANTVEGTKDWAVLDECPLENLIRRFGKRQSKPKGGQEKKKQEEKIKEEEEDDEN
ncbi:DNA glycosylase [Annulohypoxylon maeteangense]|uniref:DNA glycosylase n=1 Tax=Annulohypoxylon maeteangense TaxID=1927788 RepID=UPI002007E31B|nr:DNA glycosylase [Annulohypoxylon maeteangense]KAI0885955.1 DNA glycosylase [Annulohypoxylon maeteangense]